MRQRGEKEVKKQQKTEKTEKTEKNAKNAKNDKNATKKAEKKQEKREKGEKGGMIGRISAYMFEEEDSSILAAFRILWGFVMSYEVLEHIVSDYAKTRSSFYYSPLQFKYYPFDWVPLIPFEQMTLLLWGLLMIAIFVMIGFCYRTSSFLFLIGFSYLFLADAGNYLNHFYLIILMAILMIFLPCNCIFSVDSYFSPSLYSPTVPRWSVFIIRAELWIVYTYAGVAKINEDWLRGEPLRHWLVKRIHYPYIGWLLQYDPVIYFFSYSGLIFDLVVGSMLMCSNPFIFWAGIFSTLFFHLSNRYIFNIGIFPYLCIVSTSLFFASDWPRYFLSRVSSLIKGKKSNYKRFKVTTFADVSARPMTYKEILILILLFGFLAHQIYLPIRHHFYPGDVVWSEHGHRYSWRMKLRDKQCDLSVFAYHPNSQDWYELPLAKLVMPRHYEKMSSRPEFILQFIHFVNERLFSSNPSHLYVYSACQLNFRAPAVMINGTIDLTKEEVWNWPYSWITDVLPLSDHEKSFLPWNWPFTFKWILQKWESNLPYLRALQDQNKAKMEEITSKFPDYFEEFVCSTFFTDKRTCLQHKREIDGISESKKKLSKEANKGMTLNFLNSPPPK